MPRINRRFRVRPQNPVSRAQILELLLGPNGASVFASAEESAAQWESVQDSYSPEFSRLWYAAGGNQKPYSRIAEEYARSVVAGEKEACKWTQLACKRHLRDLERASSESGWAYRFDTVKAARVCRFLELLPHVKGNWAANAELMVLQPWQVFLLCVLFGWVKVATGMRRFSLAYVEIPRKNGKSQLAAGIGLYLFACDLEFGAEVYSGATTENQAQEVFRPARQMIERSPELAQALGVLSAMKRIYRPEDGSRFQVVVGKPGDGASPHCGIVDEYHEHNSDVLVDTFRTGMGARQQPMLFIITTAGDNTAGPCKLLQVDVCKILDGAFERDEVFGLIYSIDQGDCWTGVGSLAKANPNLDVSVFREFLVTEQQAAIVNARKQGVFQTKHLNVWVGAIARYFDLHRWTLAADVRLTPDQFIGEPCAIALDLSTKRDFTARVTVFMRRIAGRDHFYVFPRFYLPEAQVQRPEAPHYKEWAQQGCITVHDGDTVHFASITEDSIADVRKFDALEFVFDPWNPGTVVAQAVEEATGRTTVEMRQVTGVLSTPMKEMDAAIADGRVHHDGNPVLTWMIGNVMAKEDLNENVFPRKEAGREENKIDGAVALMMAIARVSVADTGVSYTGMRSVG